MTARERLGRLRQDVDWAYADFRLCTQPNILPTLRAWCMQQIAPWLGKADGMAAYEPELHKLHETHPWVFLYRFAEGRATMLDKPEIAPDQPELASDPPIKRALIYLGLFTSVARRLPRNPRFLLALDVSDTPWDHRAAPVFSFQKRTVAPNILVPDVDLLLERYVFSTFKNTDTLPFARKSNTAIFVGSTTGGIITEEVVKERSLPRLRSALFFQSNPRVTFELPNLVQCATAEVEAELRRLGFGSGAATWKEHFRHRFLLSMDGNGATCARVAIALKSRCVLVKYDSTYVLHYFSGLRPWQHYVPVECDEDVEQVLDAAERDPTIFEEIARQSRRFALAFLNRRAVEAYVEELLMLCDTLLL